MSYDDYVPEFMAKVATKTVNKRFDITEDQYNKLIEIDENLKIPPSAIIRLALNTFLPKLKDNGFKYSGVKDAWNNSKF